MADVERLLVQEDQHHIGRKIAFYQKCLVEMPDEAIVGQNARVTLEVARVSQSGKNVYRALPAPPIPSERWQDLGDGTAARQALETDWLGVTRDVGDPEVRPLGTRETSPSFSRFDTTVLWGTSLADSFVEKAKINLVLFEAEKVEFGAIVWRKTGEREEKDSPTLEPVGKVEFTRLQNDPARFNAAYSPDWMILCRVHFGGTWLEENIRWADLPAFLRAEIEGFYLLCSCGRWRYDRQNPDGYSKCEECRKVEVCVRCGEQKKATLVGSRLICEACQPYEEAEQWIREEIGDTGIAKIVAEAEKLLRGQAVSQELGERLLAATLEQTGWERTQTVEKWNGYHWYHFAEDGVWGSKLASTAIELLSHLDEASGNGLVELVAWIAQGCGRPPRNIPDFYLWTQVEGKKFPVAEFDGRTEKDLCQYIQELADLIQSGKPALAEWLRESEAARLAKREHARVLAAHLSEQYSVCPLCGQKIELSDRGGQCDCLCYGYPDGFEWEYDDDGNEIVMLLKRTTADGAEVVRCEADHGYKRRGQYQSVVRVVVAENPPPLSKQTKFVVKEFVDEAERERREQAARERRWQEDWTAACQQVESGQLLELSFRKGRHPKTGEEQWKAGSRKVKYLLDRWCSHTPVEGLVYFCSLGKNLVNASQFELWTVHICPPYPEEAPEGFEAEAAEAADGEAEPEVGVEEDKGPVDPEALKALRAKFGGR